MLRWWPQLVIGNGDREVGSGNFPPVFSSAGWELGVGWQEIWEGGIGTLLGWSQGGVAASCLCGLVSLCGALLCPGAPSLISEAD